MAERDDEIVALLRELVSVSRETARETLKRYDDQVASIRRLRRVSWIAAAIFFVAFFIGFFYFTSR